MGISSAMFSGVSGLNTLGNSMSVIGDNIANVNTIGFKSSRATFETLLAQSITGAAGTSQVGRGVAMSAVDYVWAQGSFEGTNEATDMAIGGKGFFMVRSPETGMFYTRAGHFKFDEEGYLVNPAGHRVQGWILDANSPDPRGAITDIQINATSSDPQATEEVSIAVNLDTGDAFVESAALVESDAATTSNFVFDEGGNDVLIFNEGGADITINLVADTTLNEGQAYTGDIVAETLEDELNSLGGNTYSVTYDSATHTFDIGVTGGTFEIDPAAGGTLQDVLGFSTGVTLADGDTETGAEVAFSITDENNSFNISVDGGTAETVTLTNGVYTIEGLRLELEEEINAMLVEDPNDPERVDVRYDDSDAQRMRFQIISSTRGTGSAIQVEPVGLAGVTGNFLPTINIIDYEERTGTDSNSYTNPGFTESADVVASGFMFMGGVNDGIVVDGGAAVSIITAGGATAGTVYTGDETAAFVQTALGAGYTVTYNEITDRFVIQNGTGADVTLNFTDTDFTAAEALGFYAASDPLAEDVIVTDGSQIDSNSSVAFNILQGENDELDIIVNGNPSNSGVAVHVVVPEGNYTGDELAQAMETAINEALADEGEDERVEVSFREMDESQGGRFRIASTVLGSPSTLQLADIATYSLITDTLGIDDDTINYGSGFRVDQPDESSNYSTSLVLYDTLGNQHTVTFYFRKAYVDDITNRTSWEWFAYVPGSDTASGEDEVQARGTLTFDQNGQLRSESDIEWLTTTTDEDGNLIDGEGFDFGSGAEPQQEIDISFGLGSDINVSTQFASPSSTIFQTQDGYGSGFLQDVQVDADGVISGNYSNGQVLFLARVALANFINPWGLSREGGNLFAETRSSGQPITGTAGSAGLGQIAPNSLEQSNVDLSNEFVNMIIQQRGFQANSRVITTTDDMLAELINLKR